MGSYSFKVPSHPHQQIVLLTGPNKRLGRRSHENSCVFVFLCFSLFLNASLSQHISNPCAVIVSSILQSGPQGYPVVISCWWGISSRGLVCNLKCSSGVIGSKPPVPQTSTAPRSMGCIPVCNLSHRPNPPLAKSAVLYYKCRNLASKAATIRSQFRWYVLAIGLMTKLPRYVLSTYLSTLGSQLTSVWLSSLNHASQCCHPKCHRLSDGRPHRPEQMPLTCRI